MDFIEKKRRTVSTSSVKIGKRTYFFDVKATAKDDYYLVLTESVHIQEDQYEKHRIFLYKEDLRKFEQTFGEVMAFFKAEKPEYFEEKEEIQEEQVEQ